VRVFERSTLALQRVLVGPNGVEVYAARDGDALQLVVHVPEHPATDADVAELYELDAQARDLAARCNPAVGLAVKSSIERTVLGGSVLRQLTGYDDSRLMVTQETTPDAGARLVANTDQQAAIDFVSNRLPRTDKRAEAAVLQSLVTVLCRRQMILRRVRRDIRLTGWLRLWLYVHVPLSIALLGALSAHILVTFVYW